MEEQKHDIKKLTFKEYYKPFLEEINISENTKLNKALERAWINRDFEIDKYWSRATYFWAFIAASFAGYISVISSDAISQPFKNELAFILICMGTVFTSAWFLVNIGSKKWQENWEKHIDMLEDKVTGPLYKTVFNSRGYSVSKINTLTSGFIIFIWVILAFLQGLGFIMQNQKCQTLATDWIIVGSALSTIGFLMFMIWYCRDNSVSQKNGFSFSRRKKHYNG